MIITMFLKILKSVKYQIKKIIILNDGKPGIEKFGKRKYTKTNDKLIVSLLIGF